MNEKELLEKLKQSADSITTPPALDPEQIEKTLRETQRPPKPKRAFSLYRFASLAAVFVLAILGSWQAGRLSVLRSNAPQGDITLLDGGKQITPPENGTIQEAETTSRDTDNDAVSPGAGSTGQAEAAPEPAAGGQSAESSDNAPAGLTRETSDNGPAQLAGETSGSSPAQLAGETSGSDSAQLAGEISGSDSAQLAGEISDNPSGNQIEKSSGSTSSARSGKASDSAASEPVTEVLNSAESYQALYQTLFDAFGSNDSLARAYGAQDMMEMELAVAEDAAPAEGAMDTGSMTSGFDANSVFQSTSQGNSYSKTNLQEAGVDEGDFVKTDGTYIYILKRTGSLVIVAAREGSLETVSSLPLPADLDVREMYVDGDTLSVIASRYYSEMDDSREDVIAAKSGTRTQLYTYDISDRKNPVLSGTVSQDGAFSQSRKNGDYIYLFTRFSPTILDTYDSSRIVPLTSRGELAPEEIYLPKNLQYSSYLVASAINIQNPEEITDQKAVVSVASTFYASKENIYIANENWSDGTSRTELLKLHYADGRITGTAAGTVEGYLNNSFSLNEYNGYLRAVTTSYDENYNETNGLYVLDRDLQVVGSIRDLAPGETIRSARFFGDVGYFVTFRQTDPLFSVDLSDPVNPRILDDLKISGFSAYLHFYSDSLLLGLGYEADENTGITTGLKLSMFDISDPADVKEVSKLVINGITWCDSLEDYKSILIDPGKNIFGFTCENRYMVFSYDEEKGFVKEFIYDFYNDMINESLDDSTTRGLYINNTLYLVRPGAVTAFDMENGYQEIGQLFLK